jgi:hypothetical protein
MFPEPEALLFIMEILNGFVSLVENGIIHRYGYTFYAGILNRVIFW